MDGLRVLREQPRRVAMISVHTSPLDQPGTGDAGGLNVYVREVGAGLARRGTAVEVFTRASAPGLPPTVEVMPGFVVHHVVAGPFQGLSKAELPGQLCALTSAVLRAPAGHGEHRFDLVHSHYWLSGQVGWLAKERWGVPLVHTMHTMGRVKNANLADGDTPEPLVRLVGEAQVVDAADRLVANTPTERAELIDFYDADPQVIDIAVPGVDLELFSPGTSTDVARGRAALGVPDGARMVLFVGRIQPLKAPDVLIRALADLPGDVHLVVCGGASGGHEAYLADLVGMAAEAGVADRVRFHPALPRVELARAYRAADVVAVPSHNESFGLVAIEAQASGTPVVAADVGGLRTAVAPGGSGLLVPGHDPGAWADALCTVLADDRGRARRRRAARAHAEQFSWDRTVEALLASYRRALISPRDALAQAG